MLDAKYLLTDEQMIQFITKGYVVLQNDLPQEFHQDVMKKIHKVLQEEGNPGNNILPRVPEIQKFFETPAVNGALTSILGADYYMQPHRHCHYNQPGNQTPGGGQWHKDGFWSSMRSHRPWWAMIFYYTQDITEEMGPTAIMPGTQYYEKFIGEKGETFLPTGKAGTMVLVHFDLWHRASLNRSTIDRFMLKFQFVRLSAPKYPTWNHTKKNFALPKGIPALHENLYRDVWGWLHGEVTNTKDNLPVDDSRLLQLGNDLSSEEAVIRGRAADELGFVGGAADRYAQALGNLLNDSVEAVALNAAYALGYMGPKGTDELLKQLQEGTNLVAMRAAYGLQGAGLISVPGLIKTLSHSEEKRRALAAFVLGMYGTTASEAVPSLIAILEDKSEWARRNVIEALGMIVHPADLVVPALANALETSVEQEADAENPIEIYESNQNYIINKVGYTASLSLLRAGREGDPGIVVRALKKALSSKDRYVRAYAFEALSHLRTDEAMEVLILYFRSSRWCPDTHKASMF
jgi:HEAT repeat protein